MDYVTAIVEMVRATALPGAAVWLGYYFRGELRGVAGRIVRLGPAGVELAPSPTQQTANPADSLDPLRMSTGTPTSASAPVTGAGTRTSAQEFIAKARAEISADQLDPTAARVRQELDELANGDLTAKINIMIYAYSIANIQLAHERNYHVIFGSQIELLAQANIFSDGLSDEATRAIYNRAAESYPDLYRTYTFEQWSSFLKNSGLCSIDAQQHFVVTPFGRGFLRYIIDRKLNYQKAY